MKTLYVEFEAEFYNVYSGPELKPFQLMIGFSEYSALDVWAVKNNYELIHTNDVGD